MDTRVKRPTPVGLTWNGGLEVTTKARAKSRAGNAGSKSYCVRKQRDANATEAIRICREYPKRAKRTEEMQINVRKSGNKMSLSRKKALGLV